MQTLILYNGRFLTNDPRQPIATAVAIRDGKFLAVGQDNTIRAIGGKQIDLNGRSVTAGLVDAHVHFEKYALSLQQVDLYEIPSLAEALSRISQKATSLAQDRWLQGRGWKHDLWADKQFPTAAQLDTVCGDRPAFLADKSGHAGWANSRALQIAGITAETPDPSGGEIQRDADGQPTGILFETALDLVYAHIPKPTVSDIMDAMRVAQQACWEMGLTGVHDFDQKMSFLALQQLQQNGELGLRIHKNMPDYLLDEVVGAGLQSGFGNDTLWLGGIKIFADGALGPRTATMLEPYENEPDGRTDNLGVTVNDKETMQAIASKASKNGLSVTVHAIGDRANRDILDVFETVRKEESARGETRTLLHRIEHVQLLHPDDVPRLAELNLIASMQPIHATGDIEMADLYWGERVEFGYAQRTLLNLGTKLVFGSDAPIEPIAPLLGIHAAVTRRRPDGTPNAAGWRPEQKMSLSEAIHGFSKAGYETAAKSHLIGTIAQGFLADLTIYDRDIFAIEPMALCDVGIDGTMINGRFVYQNI